MEYFFNPDGVAILGATTNPARGGYHILRNVLGGYKGRVYPVNPKYNEIMDIKCYPDISSIPEDFELLIYFIPSRFLANTILECAKKGVKGIIIESAGFSEIGEEGAAMQSRANKLAEEAGIRLWGPNCMGYLDGYSRHFFSFMNTVHWGDILKPGRVSMIVQSGMLSSGFLMSVIERHSIGISKVFSIGNKSDVNENHLLEYLINEDSTGVIGCYLESLAEGRKFIELARNTHKPVVLLKGGRSETGERAAMSHTASMSGNYEILKGAMKQAGVILVRELFELMDLVRAFSVLPALGHSRGASVVTFSGGAGTVTSDLMDDYGLPLAELSESTMSNIAKVFPEWMPPSHPLDLWPAIELNGFDKVYNSTIRAIMEDPAVDSMILEIFAYPDAGVIENIASLMKQFKKPILLWVVGKYEFREKFLQIAEGAGLPVFNEIQRCVSVLSSMREHYDKLNSRGDK